LNSPFKFRPIIDSWGFRIEAIRPEFFDVPNHVFVDFGIVMRLVPNSYTLLYICAQERKWNMKSRFAGRASAGVDFITKYKLQIFWKFDPD
jgi:hypothetical protein